VELTYLCVVPIVLNGCCQAALCVLNRTCILL